MGRRPLIILLAIVCLAVPAAGASLAPVFSDHMVIQRQQPIRVFGNGAPGESVEVRVGDQVGRAVVGVDGRWLVTLDAMEATSSAVPFRIASGERRVVELSDVVVGEVWLAAGQSNMLMELSAATGGQAAIDHADRPNIRLLRRELQLGRGATAYTVEQAANLTAERMFSGSWTRASADEASSFSAVGWWFADRLGEDLNVPVGIIQVAVGGSPTEAWIDRSALAHDNALHALVSGNWLDNDQLEPWCQQRARVHLASQLSTVVADDLGPSHPFKPGMLWAAGVEPMTPLSIRGVTWYQGESNAESATRVAQHGHLLPLLIQQWRTAFAQSELPFLFVQLPGLDRPHWPAFRDQQRRIHLDTPHTGLAVAIDTGERRDVHPRDKQIVADRLVRLALTDVYGRPGLGSGALAFDAHTDGGRIVVRFHHADGGLTTLDGGPPVGFEIAGADGRFLTADASIDGSTVIVSSPDITNPVAVRYAWSPWPQPRVNLCNQSRLPASPFMLTTEASDARANPE